MSVLVNNAGFEFAGPVEEIPLAQARSQFDTNVFGPPRLTQLVVPGMRAAGSGTIVNVSSIFGRFAVPGNAYYAAAVAPVCRVADSSTLGGPSYQIEVYRVARDRDAAKD